MLSKLKKFSIGLSMVLAFCVWNNDANAFFGQERPWNEGAERVPANRDVEIVKQSQAMTKNWDNYNPKMFKKITPPGPKMTPQMREFLRRVHHLDVNDKKSVAQDKIKDGLLKRLKGLLVKRLKKEDKPEFQSLADILGGNGNESSSNSTPNNESGQIFLEMEE